MIWFLAALVIIFLVDAVITERELNALIARVDALDGLAKQRAEKGSPAACPYCNPNTGWK